MDTMNLSRLAVLIAGLCVMAGACTKSLPDAGPLTATSEKVTAAGAYARVNIESVERITIDSGKLTLHGPSGTVAVDLPANADPGQQNKGWALVTEGEADGARSLTFTQETSLEDFTIAVPPAEGQVAYGSLGGRDGHDVLLFAYGSGSKAYWGWATISPRSTVGSR